MEIVSNVPGHRALTRSVPAAASQVFTYGDIVVLTAGVASKGTIASTAIYGFAVAPLTTGAVVDPNVDRVQVSVVTPFSEHKGEAKTGSSTAATQQSFRGTLAGFIIENGRFKVDPTATVKQLLITDAIEPFNLDYNFTFMVIPANRVLA